MRPRALIQNWIYWHGKIHGMIYFDTMKEFPDGHAIQTTTVVGPLDENGVVKTANHYYILGMRAEQVEHEQANFRPLESKG